MSPGSTTRACPLREPGQHRGSHTSAVAEAVQSGETVGRLNRKIVSPHAPEQSARPAKDVKIRICIDLKLRQEVRSQKCLGHLPFDSARPPAAVGNPTFRFPEQGLHSLCPFNLSNNLTYSLSQPLERQQGASNWSLVSAWRHFRCGKPELGDR